MRNLLLQKMANEFDVPVKKMRQIKKAVGREMDAGLAGKKSTLAMLQAYCDAASGREKGLFPALDLGGTNFRVMMVKLQGGKKPIVAAEAKYRLTQEQISSSGDVLFNAIASYVKKFIKGNGFSGQYGMGYTFSFPVKLLGIDEGILVKWTKDFSAKGVVGKKIVALQRRALERQGVANVEIVALANDTVGTLETQAVMDPNCVMGVILGTGFNICVRVSSSRIKKGVGDYTGKCMIINMEAGGFDKALPLTRYDRRLDVESGNKGQQIAEKMISGKYLSQLARLLILDLIEKGQLFDGRVPEILGSKETFRSEDMSALEGSDRVEIKRIGKLLKGGELTKAELKLLAGVCRIVARRSARISAALIAGSLSKVARRTAGKATVAIDGSLFEKYPGYHRMLEEGIRELEGRSAKGISLKLTKDGSGIGAAVIAAVVGENR